MTEDSFTELKVDIAEVKTDLKNVSRDVRNILAEMKNFVSQRELERVESRFEERIGSLERATSDRFAPLEGIVKWGGYLIVGAVITALLGIIILPRKFGLLP